MKSNINAKTKTKTKKRMVQFNQEQVDWLLAELETALMSDEYLVEEKVLASLIIKKLKGRGESADKVLVNK